MATNDENIEYPFAVGVKDSRCRIKGCSFLPLGNFRRSPVAIRAIGFSDLTIDTCRFEGFEYVICYGEETEGITQDCLIMDCGHQGIINYSRSKLRVERNVITGSKYHAVRCTGGTLNMKDNLIIDNANRGVYLGNRSGSGKISNNLIINNGTGIGGFARSTFEIENNVIAGSSYAGIGMDQSCRFTIRDNIFVNNERGWIMSDRGEEGRNTCYRNTFWQNKTDAENFSKTANSINEDPRFTETENGDFSLMSGPARELKQGLTNPLIIKTLWERWKNRADKNEPFTKKAVVKTAVEVEAVEEQKPSIGAVMELEIPLLVHDDDIFQKTSFIDFETRRLFKLPQEYQKLQEELEQDEFDSYVGKWCRENGIDAMAAGVFIHSLGIPALGLIASEGAGNIFLEISNESWDSVSAEQLAMILQHEELRNDIGLEEVPNTAAFRTIEGNVGLLQLVNLTKKADETIKIRYKIAKPTKS